MLEKNAGKCIVGAMAMIEEQLPLFTALAALVGTTIGIVIYFVRALILEKLRDRGEVPKMAVDVGRENANGPTEWDFSI